MRGKKRILRRKKLIPGRLLPSRACFRFVSATKFHQENYIYNLLKFPATYKVKIIDFQNLYLVLIRMWNMKHQDKNDLLPNFI